MTELDLVVHHFFLHFLEHVSARHNTAEVRTNRMGQTLKLGQSHPSHKFFCVRENSMEHTVTARSKKQRLTKRVKYKLTQNTLFKPSGINTTLMQFLSYPSVTLPSSCFVIRNNRDSAPNVICNVNSNPT